MTARIVRNATTRKPRTKRHAVAECRMQSAELLYESGGLSPLEYLTRANYQVTILKVSRSFDITGDHEEIYRPHSLPNTYIKGINRQHTLMLTVLTLRVPPMAPRSQG